VKLVLVRHAKSLHDEYVGADIERHLCQRGYADAEVSSEWCLSRRILPDLMVSSPAIRAYSTAMIMARRFSYLPAQIRLEQAIYNAGTGNLLQVLRSLPEKSSCVFLFGHNPGLTDLANHLCGPVCAHLPTAGIAVIQLHADRLSGTLLDLFSGHKPF
jgi:phosphohistidine phosphatase